MPRIGYRTASEREALRRVRVEPPPPADINGVRAVGIPEFVFVALTVLIAVAAILIVARCWS
jgi:hypothetical protein